MSEKTQTSTKQARAAKRGATKQAPAKKTVAKAGGEVSRGEDIGVAAGRIWQCLDRVGDASPSKLAAETGLSTKEIQRAVGWLAREGKLIIERDGRTEVFRLA
ncbi:winged helix-turn-helix domain-containing protein [Methylohalobius crimeensis]|uniref:winged helix-turn-helix domain-containing protein n=1 Tax=Methylohalobius crimeensis TaxID=244365 RepID=UPI0003B35913|nr:winged helix-turn-helix domain-containing protein [Methylohalobius crimeensis]